MISVQNGSFGTRLVRVGAAPKHFVQTFTFLYILNESWFITRLYISFQLWWNILIKWFRSFHALKSTLGQLSIRLTYSSKLNHFYCFHLTRWKKHITRVEPFISQRVKIATSATTWSKLVFNNQNYAIQLEVVK